MGQENCIPTKKLVLRICLRILLILIVIGFIILFLGPLLNLFLPFMLAFVVASFLAPVVRKITKDGSKVWNFWSMIMIVLLILAVVGIVGYLGYYLVQQVADLAGSWQSLTAYYADTFNTISGFLNSGVSITSTELEARIMELVQSAITMVTDKLSTWVPSVFSGVTNIASAVGSFVIAFLFFLVGAYFMTADYPGLRKRISAKIPGIIRPHMNHLREAMGSAMFGYIKAQLILSGVVCLVIFLALTVYGQPYSLLIAIAAGIIDLIPFFGSGTVLVPWAIVTLLWGDYPKALMLIILALVLFLFRKLAEPKVMGNQTGLSPLLSLVSIYVGLKTGGVIGMILVPVLCMIVIGLYDMGFFDPTIQDFKMLFYRIIDAARIEKET